MILYTIQPSSVLHEIQEKGRYHFDSAQAPLYSDFSPSYQWMEQEMQKRGITPSVRNGEKEPLVWAWHTWEGERKIPEYKDQTFVTDGREDRPVCIEIDIPDEKVLLSDFNAWHSVLNHLYIDDSTNEEEFDRMHAEFQVLPEEEKQRKMEESWQKIFDITKYESEWRSNGMYVQAVFYGLYREQIVRVYE